MSTLEKNLYKRTKVTSVNSEKPITSRTYRGTSTVNIENSGFALYDLALIKQDLINHFHIRQGEKLENPEFGTIIWDVLFEPMTSGLQNAILENVTEIINYDPRVQANDVVVDTYESGIQIYAELTYIDYNISEQLTLRFDQNNGLLN